LDRRWELQEPQRVRDRDAAASDARRHLIVSEVEVLDELLVRGCILERVEVGAMDVLDQGVLEGRRVVGGTDQRPDRLQARRTPVPREGAGCLGGGGARARGGAPRPRGSTGPAGCVAPPHRARVAGPGGAGPPSRAAPGPRRRRGLRPRRRGSGRRVPYPDRLFASRHTSFASSRYALAPREVESNTMMGCPNDGASESRTVRGTTVSYTRRPKW